MEKKVQNFQEKITDIVASLRACAKQKDLQKGTRLHVDISKSGLLDKSCHVASALVSMYAKCGALALAQQVLDELPVRDVVSWSALIAGYAQMRQGEEALKSFDRMQYEGHCPNAVTLTCILKACGTIGASDKGQLIHEEIVRKGWFGKDIVLANALVYMYVKCGALLKARQVLDELPIRNVVTWSTLIAGYAQQGQGEKALSCFERMQHEGHSPNAVTFACILKACATIQAAEKGKLIHEEIMRQGLLEKNLFLGNALVDMYVKCGALAKAEHVLDELFIHNVVTWNAVLAGYAQQGQGKEALSCFERMQHEGLSPDAVTFICILIACASLGAEDKGKQIHDEAVRQGWLGKDLVLGTTLVDMYAKCGALAKAQQVLDELSVRDVVSWNALIAGYSQQGQSEEALTLFERMQHEGLSPDAVTFTCILTACASIGALDQGKQVHIEILRNGLLEKNVVLGTALLDMYARCGAVSKAQRVLNELSIRNVVTWNALIAGYAQQGQGEEALNCLQRMQHEGLTPDAITFTCILTACASIEAADKGKEIHEEVVRQGLLGKNVVLGTALVDMYAKCGALSKAQRVLDELPVQNVVSWNALISGYAQQGQGLEALSCFVRMQCKGLSPDAVTFICILTACASIGAANKGEQIHEEIVRGGFMEHNTVLGNALVDMYAKCGALSKAQQMLDELPLRNVVSWNVLIAAYAQQGQSVEVLNCFERMQGEGFCPDAGTLVCVLNACSHSGLLGEGQLYFWEMSTKYGIMANVEHYCCMVDLFGRAGDFNKASVVIGNMPYCDYLPIWHALLGTCWKAGNVKLGRLAFEHAVRLDGNDTATYICMSNIYAAAGMQEEAARLK